jgi:hypothetical protein
MLPLNILPEYGSRAQVGRSFTVNGRRQHQSRGQQPRPTVHSHVQTYRFAGTQMSQEHIPMIKGRAINVPVAERRHA